MTLKFFAFYIDNISFQTLKKYVVAFLNSELLMFLKQKFMRIFFRIWRDKLINVKLHDYK